MLPVILLVGIQAQLDINDEKTQAQQEILIRTDAATDIAALELSKASLLLTYYEDALIRPNACLTLIKELQTEVPSITNALWISQDGTILCSAIGENNVPMDDLSWIETLKTSRQDLISDAFFGSRSQRWIFGVFRPLFTETGEFDGAIALGIDANALLELVRAKAGDSSLRVALLDSGGNVFGHDAFTKLPSDYLSDPLAAKNLRTIKIDGTRFDVTRSPIGPSNIEALLAQPQPSFSEIVWSRPMRSIFLPALLILAAALALWLAAEVVVVKYLTRLQRVVRIYGAGRYSLTDEETIKHAPDEISELAAGLAMMSTRISEREVRLQDALKVRDGAIKEVHHRVKNNLQIVSSFLSLEARASDNQETRDVLGKARARISALSVVHQTLYQYERLDEVAIGPFLDVLLSHLDEALGIEDSGVNLIKNIDDANIASDDAIPIALVILELITNSMKYAFGSNSGEITVSFTALDDGFKLTVSDNGHGGEEQTITGTGLGGRLLLAFTRQLNGTLDVSTDNGRSTSISFPK
jgi:two-component sensor histidine kinase